MADLIDRISGETIMDVEILYTYLPKMDGRKYGILVASSDWSEYKWQSSEPTTESYPLK